MSMRIISFTANPTTGSSRFRIRQYGPLLKQHGIELIDIPSGKCTLLYKIKQRIRRHTITLQLYPKTSLFLREMNSNIDTIKASDILWFSRDCFPIYLSNLPNKSILDLDDAIWLHTPQISEVAKRVDHINVGNNFLAEWAQKYCRNITIIPTCIDISSYKDCSDFNNDKFIIGWSGTPKNLRYMSLVEASLAKLLAKYKDIELHIMCNTKPRFSKIPEHRYIYFRFNTDIELDFFSNINVGLMPLFDTDWEKGKCSFKMLQYMAAGKPAIASPVGMNVEVLEKDKQAALTASNETQWYESLEYLYKNRDVIQEKGRRARKVVEQHYSVQSNVGKLVNIFKKYS